MRVPVVAGVGGGVGTTTVAAALRAHDAGRMAGRWPDILVCRGTLDSLGRAAAVLGDAGREPLPVLAVTLDAARVFRGPLQTHLAVLEPDVSALVLLPRVQRWATLTDPLAEAARLLAGHTEQLPRALRAYAAALRQVVDAVAASGRLATIIDRRPTRGTATDERAVRPQGLAQTPTSPVRAAAVGGMDAARAAAPVGHVRDRRPVLLDTAVPGPRGQGPRGIRIVSPDGTWATATPLRRAPETGDRSDRVG
jgi:hypothetical protein